MPKFENLTMKKPANGLVAALQLYCKTILEEPEKYAIEDLYALEERIWEHANEIKAEYPRCKLSDLKSDVFISEIVEAYRLVHRKDNILESIVVHINKPGHPLYKP